MSQSTCASLFSGGGLWEIGAKQAGFAPTWAIELEPSIADVFRANHPSTEIIVASVQDVDIARLEAVDLLHASPPCQAHSQARSKSLDKREDEEVGLIVLDYIKALRPRFFTLENVPPFQHHKTFKAIVAGLIELNYSAQWSILNAADFGVPQTRRRLILRAVRGGLVPMLSEPTPWQGWYSAIEDLIPTLPESAFAPWQLARLPEELTAAFLIPGDNTSNKTIRYQDQPMVTVRTRSTGQCPHRAWLGRGRVVLMTPRALARFQSVPDSYQLPDNNALACKVIGNGVPPELARLFLAGMENMRK